MTVNIYKIRRKNLIAISITKLLHGFGNNIFSVVYQVYLFELTNSLIITGIIVSIGSIMQFLPMPFIGKMSDKYNRKLLITFSVPVYIMGIIFLIVAEPSAIYLAILGIMLYFLGFTLNNLNSQFIISESTKKSKGLMYSFMFSAFFLGTIGGSILIIFGPEFDARVYFEIFILILAIEGLLYIFLLSNKTQIKPVKSGLSDKKENQWIKILKTKTLRSILIFFTLDIFVYGLSLSIYNAGLRSFYNLSVENIAILSMGINITNMLFQIPAGRITDKIGSKKTLILSQIFGLSFFLINIIAVNLWTAGFLSPILILLLIGHVLFAISVVTFIPSEQVILTDLDKEKKAESYGIVSFSRGLAYIPTGYIGGLIVENLGYLTLFIFSFIGILLEIFYLLRFFHHHPQS
ncbi:MAG: MFS transporter [Candidatus Hermodarchaeota archaeon]